jgi:hypothetical protein
VWKEDKTDGRVRTHACDCSAMEDVEAILGKSVSEMESGARTAVAWNMQSIYRVLLLDIQLEVYDAGLGGGDTKLKEREELEISGTPRIQVDAGNAFSCRGHLDTVS